MVSVGQYKNKTQDNTKIQHMKSKTASKQPTQTKLSSKSPTPTPTDSKIPSKQQPQSNSNIAHKKSPQKQQADQPQKSATTTPKPEPQTTNQVSDKAVPGPKQGAVPRVSQRSDKPVEKMSVGASEESKKSLDPPKRGTSNTQNISIRPYLDSQFHEAINAGMKQILSKMPGDPIKYLGQYLLKYPTQPTQPHN